MRMVIAYIRGEAFEPIRRELLDLGFGSLSIAGVDYSDPGAATTMQYRGATLTTHLRPRVKLECMVSTDDVSTIVDTVLKHARAHSAGDDQVFVVPVEAFPDPVEAFLPDPGSGGVLARQTSRGAVDSSAQVNGPATLHPMIRRLDATHCHSS